MVLIHLIFYYILVLITAISDDDDEGHFHQHIPFFVMQPHTVINQTLHSYCKEQFEFIIQPMFLNLTQWPSGFIYARNPQQTIDNEDRNMFSTHECTTELHASHGDRIRLVFYPIVNLRNDYDQDYFQSIPRAPCLKVHDNFETTTFECPMILDRTKYTSYNRRSDDYLSNNNVIYLEIIPPPVQLTNDYDDTYHQFKLFFTTFTPKFRIHTTNEYSRCPRKHLLDCEDGYCVHINARCNGISDCRSKVDEEFCQQPISCGRSISPISYFYIHLFIIIIPSTL
ncbi:unnamed protein product [Adineta ricciae]|uniref:Uncharacterized protein n=1 Tax=Adineta ricciae TaxID=249248 RepID=A0A815DNM0_ADIRI|nr:unnamed protein product [Adineta ricciae]